MIGKPLTPQQQKILDAAKQHIEAVVIPEIVATMQQRQIAAAKAREIIIRT